MTSLTRFIVHEHSWIAAGNMGQRVSHFEVCQPGRTHIVGAFHEQRDAALLADKLNAWIDAAMFQDEGDRQLTLLALAELALSRPGFDHALGKIAEQLSGREMFEAFKRLNADRVKPLPPLGPPRSPGA